MAILLVDAGNTRFKWAVLEAGRLGRTHAAGVGGARAAELARPLRTARLERALVASVAPPRVVRALRAAARRAGVQLDILRTPRRGGGVTVGYAEPWRLGVDRFAGAVGAHGLFPGVPVCVVGVGTALTLDLVRGDGRHLGGAIVPAPDLMIAALLDGTHGIRRRARGGGAGRGLYARSTRGAIVQGARYAAAALVDRAVAEARAQVGREPLVVLTGGGADAVRALIASRCVGVPDLVLRGLAALARARGPRRAPWRTG